jgi:uncharacterized protein (TIGR03000 family)
MFRFFFTHFGVPVLAAAVGISLGGIAAAAPQQGHGHGGSHGGAGHGGGGYHGGGAHIGGYHGGGYHGGGYGHGWGGYGRGWGGYGYGRGWGYGGYGRGWGYGGYWPYYSGLGLGAYRAWPAYDGGYSSYYYSPSYYDYVPSYSYGLSTYPYDSSYDGLDYPDAGYTYDQPAPTTAYQGPYPESANEPSPVDSNAAVVRVRVPADATLWFENERTRQTGPAREFVTPPLTPGNEYTYHIRAQWMQNGHPVESGRDVLIRAGDRLTIDMTGPSTTFGAGGEIGGANPANRPPKP